MLKASLTQKEKELSIKRQETYDRIEERSRQQQEKEKNMQSEIDCLKTQLQFKDHEVIELQNSFRKLEHKSRSMQSTSSSASESVGGQCQSPRRPGVQPQSPRRPGVQPHSPCRHGVQPHSPRRPIVQPQSPHTPKSNFPTKHTFHADERSPQQKKTDQADEDCIDGRIKKGNI